MTTTYQQPSSERCVRSMKKSGKLAIALILLAVGALLLLLGNRAGKDTSPTMPDGPTEVDTPSVEEYRADGVFMDAVVGVELLPKLLDYVIPEEDA